MSGRLVLLSGLPGTGKSAVARAFCAGPRAVHLRIDTIEAAITGSSLRPVSPEEAGYAVAAAQAAELTAAGHVVVADAVNAVPEARAIWGRAALVVEIVCSDLARHAERVAARHAADPATPDWSAVCARRWVPWDRPVHRLDAARTSPEALAARIWAALG